MVYFYLFNMLNENLFTLKEEEKATREGFGEALADIGADEKIVAICADLTDSVKMSLFKEKFPKRFFEMGITEQAMSGVASGLASMGKIPFMASYAMFSPGRNWEQIRTTICYNNVPVKIIGAHAGVSVGPDGATHQALEDIALMRVLPNMNVIVPCDAIEAYEATKALVNIHKPVYLRLTREPSPVILKNTYQFSFGKGYIMHIPKKQFAYTVGIIGCGPVLYEALRAAKELEKEGIGVTVANMPTVKPLDEKFLFRFAKDMKKLVTVEEHQKAGGLGSAVAEYLSENLPTHMEMVAVEDRFGQSGTVKDLYNEYGLTYLHIMEKVRKVLGR
jgi:transketolase